MITKLEKFVVSLLAHVFKSLETFIVYENTLDKLLPKTKKKRDGRIVPDKFYGLKKYTYRKVICGTTYKDLVKTARILEGKTSDVDIAFVDWISLGTNHALFEHNNTKNKAVRGYWHEDLIKEKIAINIYEKSDGSFLTKEEIEELYSYLSKSDSNKHDLEKEVEVRNYDITKLKYFKNGELDYNDLSDSILIKLGLR